MIGVRTVRTTVLVSNSHHRIEAYGIRHAEVAILTTRLHSRRRISARNDGRSSLFVWSVVAFLGELGVDTREDSEADIEVIGE